MVKVNSLTYDDTAMEFDLETELSVKSFGQMKINNIFEDKCTNFIGRSTHTNPHNNNKR